MFIDIFLIVLLFLLLVPFPCGYYAHTHGRSFWLWVLLGTLLPVISYFILLLLPDRTNPVEAEIDELKIRHSLLGRKHELPTDAKLRKLMLTQKDHIKFVAIPSPQGSHQVLDIRVNGQALADWLHQGEVYPVNTDYEGLPVHDVWYPSAHFLGQPLHLYWGDLAGRTALLIHCVGGTLTKAIMARVDVYPNHILFHDFACVEGTATLRMPKVGPLIFNRFAYVEALDKITKPITERRG
jgi:hypothetical protein